MPTFLVEALGVSIISFLADRILRKIFTHNNNNVNNINIDYQPQSTQDEIVIVAETNSNKLLNFLSIYNNVR
jgi:hypothetical protein